nr:ABC transporter permease subunit [Propionibacterium sp.]
MTWFLDHVPQVWSLLVTHAVLAALPLLLGLLVAVPLGWLARRYPRLYPPVVAVTGLLYTIPSLALFILMPLVIGTGILDPRNVVVALTLYTVALLVRTVADGLAAVPDHVLQAATAMGIGPLRRFLAVELPLAVPVIASGLRVAAVSNVSIVSVAALIGVPQLGSLFTDGFARAFLDPIVVGIVASVLLAAAFDLAILAGSRALTPWVRARGAR